MRSEVHGVIVQLMQQRKDELAKLTRTPMLARGSNLKDYENHVVQLKGRIEAGGLNSPLIQDTEALLSLGLDLKSGLEKILLRGMDPTANDTSSGIDRDSDQELEKSPDKGPGECKNDSDGDSDSGSSESRIGSDSEPKDDNYADDQSDHEGIAGAVPTSATRCKLPHPLGLSMDIAVPSIETPKTTPRTLHKLQDYETAYQRALKAQAEGEAILRDEIGEPLTNKRKKPENVEFETPISNKRRRRTESQRVDDTPDSASSFSFPPLSELVLRQRKSKEQPHLKREKSRDRRSKTGNATSPVIVSGDSPTLASEQQPGVWGMNSEGRMGVDNSPSPPERVLPKTPHRMRLSQKDPNLTVLGTRRGYVQAASQVQQRERVTPARGHHVNPSQTDRRPRFGSGRNDPSHRGPGIRVRGHGQVNSSSSMRFRESTADFEAMTPRSREVMLFQAVKGIVQGRQGQRH